MKLRLRAELERARNAAEGHAGGAGRNLHRALSQLEVARIGTIHSLCSDLLREFPVEARVVPLFEVMPEEEAQRLFEACFDAWFQEMIQQPPEGVRRVLRRRTGRGRDGPRETLREAAWKLAGHRDFTAPWRRDRLRSAGDARRRAGHRSPPSGGSGEAAEAGKRRVHLAKALDKVRRFAEELGLPRAGPPARSRRPGGRPRRPRPAARVGL